MESEHKSAHRFGLPRYSSVRLLVALGLLFVFTPFIEDLPRGDLIEALLLSLVMLSGVLAVGARRRHLVIALMLGVPAVVSKWVNHLRPDLLPPEVFLIATVVFFGFVFSHLLRFIVRAPRVNMDVLCAGVAGFLMLGLLWTPVYLIVARLDPAAFNAPQGSAFTGFSAFYFSFITLCTVGYGDISPVSKIARMLAVGEAIIGLFYMAVLISRLVSVYSSTKPAAENDNVDKR
jgi:voltage-gated potassium channel